MRRNDRETENKDDDDGRIPEEKTSDKAARQHG